jgi:hypothetical protein
MARHESMAQGADMLEGVALLEGLHICSNVLSARMPKGNTLSSAECVREGRKEAPVD